MVALIFSTLAVFGLTRKDYKYRKLVNQKEKEDEIKRPIQNYFLQPSSIMVVAILVIGSLSAFLLFSYQSNFFLENTEKEISQMSGRREIGMRNLDNIQRDLVN